MKKILTIILDGFGMREEIKGNAIKLAKPTNFINLWNNYPHCLLKASEKAVGLTEGQFGNSEVGHLTIGAGRLIKQGIRRIEDALNSEEILKSENYQQMIKYIKDNNKAVHIMYLVSDGGVHSHNKFALKMLELLHREQIKKVYFHLITDGRDTAPTSSSTYINELAKKINELQIGTIGTICGRYYAMDRDKNWPRTKMYYELVTRGVGLTSQNIYQTIDACYKRSTTDEFLPPILINSNSLIKDGDCLLWLNFRADRAKQILNALTNPNFTEFHTNLMPNLKLYSFFEVDDNIPSHPFIPEEEIDNTLGSYISQLGLSQARIAETEKYAHVTYFFDGGKELKLDKCDRYLIPSPKVATYDMKPEMSAVEITKTVIKCMEKDYDFILMNFANPDMVGHTGNLEATIKAIQAVDVCLGKIAEVANDNFYTVVILADHGNAEIMLDKNNNPVTTHTTSLVPFIITDKKVQLVNGDLTMVAPTILKYMDIALPKEMKESEDLFFEG